MLAFELKMPGVNTWNGQWTGEEKRYVKVLKIGAKCEAKPGSYGYNFSDGWIARVDVREVDRKEACKLIRVSAGFCGYDWMIKEICLYGRIKTLKERKGVSDERAD